MTTQLSVLFFVIFITALLMYNSLNSKNDFNKASVKTNPEFIMACKIAFQNFESDRDQCDNTSSNSRIIVLGDVHGSLNGVKEILYKANVTKSPLTCKWKANITNTILVQVGDIVDRGPQALESWKCFEKLQQTSVDNNVVIRLLGNHDIMWLENQFVHRNKTTE
jgi:metallophosphoesterase superfamily enzyme